MKAKTTKSKQLGHTPGPWKATEYQRTDTSEYCVGVDTDYPAGLRNGSRSIVNCTGGAYLRPAGSTAHLFKPELLAENRANAQLIAAAPELLAALREADNVLELAKGYFPKSIRNRDLFTLLNVQANSVRAAIAKAEGI